MNLSENFTLAEMTRTMTGLFNEPDIMVQQSLCYLAQHVLQPIRDRWGALRISSGYRSPQVNAAVGGSTTSQHLLGEAADFIPLHADMNEVYRWIVEKSGLAFGQVILEPSWIHISLIRMDKPNQQALTFDGKEYKIWQS